MGDGVDADSGRAGSKVLGGDSPTNTHVFLGAHECLLLSYVALRDWLGYAAHIKFLGHTRAQC